MLVQGELRVVDLPSAANYPEEGTVARQVRGARARLARREFMRVAVGAAVGTGLAFASLFPSARAAQAHLRTWPFWGLGSDNCILGGGYAGSTGCCACGSLVSSTYCADNGWHNHHSEQQGGGTAVREHRIRETSCNDRNAWIWARGGTSWRCSDGQRRVCTASCGAWANSVCPWRV
jgi:hypothetical protein